MATNQLKINLDWKLEEHFHVWRSEVWNGFLSKVVRAKNLNHFKIQLEKLMEGRIELPSPHTPTSHVFLVPKLGYKDSSLIVWKIIVLKITEN